MLDRTDELTALRERRNETKARIHRLKTMLIDLEQDKRCLLIEIAKTNEKLRYIEIDLDDVERETNP